MCEKHAYMKWYGRSCHRGCFQWLLSLNFGQKVFPLMASLFIIWKVSHSIESDFMLQSCLWLTFLSNIRTTRAWTHFCGAFCSPLNSVKRTLKPISPAPHSDLYYLQHLFFLSLSSLSRVSNRIESPLYPCLVYLGGLCEPIDDVGNNSWIEWVRQCLLFRIIPWLWAHFHGSSGLKGNSEVFHNTYTLYLLTHPR